MIRVKWPGMADGTKTMHLQEGKAPQDGTGKASGLEAQAGSETRRGKLSELREGSQTDLERGDSMTSRERPGPESGTATSTRNPARPMAPLPTLLTAPGSLSVWEQWYRQASLGQRQQLLDQARQQGLLYAHQLPPPETQPESAGPRSLLTSLLAGRPCSLDTVFPCPISPTDTDLDEVQREAVARALGTPDLALINGYPGSGKTRVVVEILRQAVRSGLRVLLTSPTSAALDRALERLAGDTDLGLLRWVSPQEPLADLSTTSLRFTLPGRLRYYDEHTLPTARQTLAACRGRVEARRSDAETWKRLLTLLDQQERLHRDTEALSSQQTGLVATLSGELEVSAPASALREQWQQILDGTEQALRDLTEQLAPLRVEIERLEGEQRQREEEKQQLAPLAEAKQGHRWWTGAFWRATVGNDPTPRLDEIAALSRQADERLQVLLEQEGTLEASKQEILERRNRERTRLLEDERQRREADLLARRTSLLQNQEQWSASWKDACESLSAGTPRPTEPTREAVLKARATWEKQSGDDEADLLVRQGWVEALEQAQQGLAADLLASTRLVVSTLSSLPVEPFPGSQPGQAEFDLVVCEDAHRLTEADLASLARRVKRLVLVGDASTELPIAPPPRRPNPDRPRVVPLPLPYTRLWKTLHPDPRRLAGRWRHVEDRLIVTLRTLTPEQQAEVQHEPVFDRPDVEVGIYACAGHDPCIAEVIFPGSTTISEAKEFIHRELQDLAMQATGSGLRWHETPSTLLVELSGPAEPEATVVCLENGIRERIGRCGGPASEVPWPTCCLEFDRAAGWDRSRAERWVEENLGLRDTGRTAVLGRSYRARPALWRFLANLLYSGRGQAVRDTGVLTLLAPESAVEFVAVPPTSRIEPRRPPEPEPRWSGGGTATLAPRVRQQRGGAGVEADLTDARRPDTLPADLRARLTTRGVVNHPEALAIVEALEELVRCPDFLSAALAWQRSSVVPENGEPSPRPVVAVSSPFPTQVELLRLMVERSVVLASAPVVIEVAEAAALAQREFLVVMLSLTRSHASRAVPFSDHPNDLVVLLTRAVDRLLVFGDPGTMNRRTQWFGTLDHLDEASGPMEQALIGQLLAQVPELETAGRPLPVGMGRTHVPPRESSSV